MCKVLNWMYCSINRMQIYSELLGFSIGDRKKLSLWWEDLLLMDQRLFPEGSVSESLCLGWKGSLTILPAHFRVLEACRSWRLQSITFSAELMTHCSPPLSLAVATGSQVVTEHVFSSHLMPWEMMVHRKWNDSTGSRGVTQDHGVSWCPQWSPLIWHHWAPGCCFCIRLPGCHLLRRAQWGWCHSDKNQHHGRFL